MQLQSVGMAVTPVRLNPRWRPCDWR